MDIPWKWTALFMALIAMTSSAIAIQDVRTKQTSMSSMWYKATIAMLVVSIVAVLGILFGFYHEQQKALAKKAAEALAAAAEGR
jgi:ABC-type sulfate transport system permease component